MPERAHPLAAEPLGLLRSNEPTTASARGGFGQFRGDEIELATEMLKVAVSDELETVDSGVGCAFGPADMIGEPRRDSSDLGATRRAGQYQTAAGLDVHVAAVVAVPSTANALTRVGTSLHAWAVCHTDSVGGV